MNCPKCNKPIPDGGRYCPYCGNRSLLPNQSYPSAGDELTTSMGSMEEDDELTTAIQPGSSSQGTLSGPAKGFRFNDGGRSRSICTDDPTAGMLQSSATSALNNDYATMPGTQSLSNRQAAQNYAAPSSYASSASTMNAPQNTATYNSNSYNPGYAANANANAYGAAQAAGYGQNVQSGYASAQNGYGQDIYAASGYSNQNAGYGQPQSGKKKGKRSSGGRRKKGPRNIWKYIAIVLIVIGVSVIGWFGYQYIADGKKGADESTTLTSETSGTESSTTDSVSSQESDSNSLEPQTDDSGVPSVKPAIPFHLTENEDRMIPSASSQDNEL